MYQNQPMRAPWVRFFMAVSRALSLPVDLASSDVIGVLDPDHGGANPTPSGSGVAPVDAEYLVGAADPVLTDERVVTDTTTAVWDLATPGQAKVDVQPATVPVAVDVAGALDGDGTTGDPLAVRVDGVTVTINGSNELEASVAALTETFLTAADESGTLVNSRQLLAGTNVTFDDAVANQRTVNVASSVDHVVMGDGAVATGPLNNGGGQFLYTPYTP
jgi:hypothetical protein